MNPSAASTPTADLLTTLKAIHAPLEPGFWPPSWEFWLTIGALVVLALLASIAHRKRQGPPWYQDGKKLLDEQFVALAHTQSNDQVAALNQVIKRIALSLYARQDVAHLYGHAWCEWLNTTGKCQDFTQGIGLQLGLAAYDSTTVIDPAAVPHLRTIVFNWLKAIKKSQKKPMQQHKSTLSLPGQFEKIRHGIIRMVQLSAKGAAHLVNVYRQKRTSKKNQTLIKIPGEHNHD